MRIFLTGATGFIGGTLARQLAAAGHNVVAIARNPDKAGDLSKAGVLVVRGDVTERASLVDAMRGAEVVFHIAGWYKVGVNEPEQAQAINVEGTRNVLDVMREHGIPRGVYTSTLAINSDTGGRLVDETFTFSGTHRTVYDRTKADAHHVAVGYIREGLPLTIVMPGLVYGPGDTSTVHETFVSLLKGRLPMIPRDVYYSPAYIDDIAHAHWLALEKGQPGEHYIIGGEVASLPDLLRAASTYAGVPMPRVQVSGGMMLTSAKLAKPFDGLLPRLYRSESLMSSATSYTGSNAKARRELGYDPRPLSAGIPPTIDWELAQLGMKRKV
jgi:nucleoside-diphosphate-sugar epimerase